MKYLLFVVFFNPEKLTSSPDYAWIIFYFNKKKMECKCKYESNSDVVDKYS